MRSRFEWHGWTPRGARTNGPRKTGKGRGRPESVFGETNAFPWPVCVPFFSSNTPVTFLWKDAVLILDVCPRRGRPRRHGRTPAWGWNETEHKRRHDDRPGSPPPVTHVYNDICAGQKGEEKDRRTVRWKETDVVRERERKRSEEKKETTDGEVAERTKERNTNSSAIAFERFASCTYVVYNTFKIVTVS